MESLDLSWCGLIGKLPSSLGMLKRLQHLDLSSNLFNSSIPQSLGQLSQLFSLDLSNNSWQGNLTETHFMNFTRLKFLYLSTTESIIFNLTDEWIPHFKLQIIEMVNCHIGPGFPAWLQSQTKLAEVRLQNAGISGAIPKEWMSNISSQIVNLDLSYNQISGKLPLQFYFPTLYVVDFNHNQFDGTIPSSICNIPHLVTLALNNNQLSGVFPKEWSLWIQIAFVDVSYNYMSGNIPSSMGIPSSLVTLKTENNHFSGNIPSALQNCSSSLQRLNLGGNKFTGSIPSWIGSNLSEIRVLQLQSNSFSRHIPHHLCSLSSLKILDLSQNRFSGTIPRCLNNLTSLVSGSGADGWESASEEFEVTSVTTKGRENEYSVAKESLLNIIDLSSNYLEGEIPEELSSLVQLDTLNLSMNQLSGNIPSKIGKLYHLETLDLSQNQLSGHIPQSLSNLTFLLSHLNLSHNNWTGRIPYISRPQLQTLDDPSIYEGNSLCGFPLPKCREDGDIIPRPHVHEKKDHGELEMVRKSLVSNFLYQRGARLYHRLLECLRHIDTEEVMEICLFSIL